MRKIVNIGTVPVGSRRANVYCKIENENGRLSISGVVGPLPSGNALGGCGQIDMEFKHRNEADDDKRYGDLIGPNEIKFSKGWNATAWFDFLEVWKKWHLNDMHAGCEHQREWEQKNYDELPEDKACKVCGYEYGTAWNSVKVPEDVLDFLASLPETTKQPAWC